MAFILFAMYLMTSHVGSIFGEDIMFVGNLNPPQIYSSNISPENTSLHFTEPIQVPLSRPKALDYNPNNLTLYWLDVSSPYIVWYSFATNENGIVTDIFGIDALAVDGKKNKLYWTNSAESKIEAVNTDGTNKTVLFDTNLDTPLAIEVDTINGIRYLYWSNCGNTVQNIERAPLDDLSKRTQIVTGGLVYPSGIALSVSNGKMYWCDSGTDVIEEANLDGTERRIIANLTGHPSDIEVYKNYLYWTDWTGGIHRLDRMTGIQSIESSDSRLIQTGPLYVGPFKVQDDCGGCMNNGTCVSTEDDISTCTCPNGYMGAICEIVVGYCPCALP